MVPNKLKPIAKVAIVIDQPSDQDNVSNKLMSDDVMAHMAGYLASAGILTSQCSMLSVVQEKHPNLRNLHDGELMCWTELLRRDLNAIKPNMIITIGEIATQVITGKKKHELYRGSVLPSLLSDCKTLVLWNPCHASNPKTPWITAYKGRAEWKPFTSWDCQKAARHRDTSDYLSINPEIIVTKDMNLIRKEFLSYDYVNDPASKLACDIEASYCEMTCIGFAKENKKAYVIPLVHMEGMELAEALDVIDKVLQSKVRKSFQNGNFDVTYMGYYYGIKVMNFHWDTMLAMHCVAGYQTIDTLEGKIPIQELVGRDDVWVWSWDGKKAVPRKALTIQPTRLDTQIVRVHAWRQGTSKPEKIEIDCTPDHQFLVNGEWVEAQNLAPKTRLTRVKLGPSGGRNGIYRHGNFVPAARYVWEELHGKIPTGYVIHHKNEIVTDDRPENLELLTDSQHKSYHAKKNQPLKHHQEEHDPWNTDYLGGKLARPEEVEKLYSSGMSQLRIAKVYGASQANVSRFMQKHEIKARKLTEAQQLRREAETNCKVIEVAWLADKCDTYCMEIEGTHCLSANGVIIHNSMFPNLPKGLGILGSIFTEEPYWKDESKDGEDQKTWLLPYHKVNWPRFFIYNGKDTANLITIWEEQEDLMDARGTRSTFEREMRICKPLITMELQGVKVNPVIQASMAAKLDTKIQAWELFLENLLGEDNINVGSYQQLRNLLYDKMKLPVRTKKNKVTSDGDALLSLIRFDPVVLKAIIILKDLKKQRQFTKIKYNLEDTRVRTTFKPGGTATGRLSSSQSITKTGTNLQQQPKWAREFYVPDDGMILVQADYSKAESWIVAALAKDEKMIEALLGPDFHSTNAGNLLGRPVTKADYDDRQLGKRVSHGVNYGMTEFLLHKVLIKAGFNFTKSEVAALAQAYHDAYPGIRTNYHNWIKDCLQRDMTLETPFGRKVTFYDFWGTRLFNKAYAWIPQSTIGDMTNTALCQVYENMGHYCDLLIQVHDSLVLQVKPENFTQGFVDDLAGNMIVPLEVKGTKFSVPIDVEAGLDWYHLHEWDDLKAEREQFGNTAQFAMAVNNINNRKALKKATKEHAAEELTDDFMGEDLFAS